MKKILFLLASIQFCFSFEIPTTPTSELASIFSEPEQTNSNHSLERVFVELDDSGSIITLISSKKDQEHTLNIQSSADRGKTWTSSHTLSANYFGETIPTLAIDHESGNAIAVWEEECTRTKRSSCDQQSNHPCRDIFISYSQDHGRTWSEKKCIFTKETKTDGDTAIFEAVLFPNGNALIYGQYKDRIELFESSDFGQNWNTSATFSVDQLLDITSNQRDNHKWKCISQLNSPALSYNQKGTAIKINAIPGNRNSVVIATTDFGKTWKALSAPDAREKTYWEYLHVQPDGTVFCSWSEWNNICYATAESIGAEWTEPMLFPHAKETYTNLGPHISANNHGIFLTEHPDYFSRSKTCTVFTTENSGRDWIEHQQHHFNGIDNFWFHTLLTDDGHSLLAWHHSTGKKNTIQYKFSDDYGREWSAVNNLISSTRFRAIRELRMNKKSNAVLLWIEESNGKYTLCGAYSDDFGKTWQQ